jgi:hypothetical protein
MKVNEIITEAANPAQQAAIAISMKKAGKKPKSQGVAEGSDFFAGSKFADEDGNTFSVEKIIAFAKKNPKYFHKDFPLSKIKHDLSWWQGNKERMMNADTSFPLLVIQNDDGHLGVADGLNRMKKAVDVEKKTTIDVYLVPKKDIMKFSEKQGVAEDKELAEEFDLIESIIERLAAHNGVDAEVIWEDLETLTEDELYAFAVTSEPIMESQDMAEGPRESVSFREMVNVVDEHYPKYYAELSGSDISDKQFEQKIINAYKKIMQKQDVAEDWQKANKRDKTDGMSQKAVNAYRRENPGSKLKTAVTTKPSKLKKGGKASKRRKSYCSRSRGQMKMHSISCAKTPDKAICKARRRWNC